jgi:DNA repair protein RecN (Recombination protein N)
MLTELRIENFAIIQQLALEFTSGLIAFTGETGAGKSILLDAIMAIVGGRVDGNAIRSGADRATVEATFRLSDKNREAVYAILKREDLLDDPNYVILARELRREGRTIARVNGRSVSAGLLRELGEYLVDIHGQSEHLSLLNVHQHIGLLDRYANVKSMLVPYQKTYHELVQVRKNLKELRQEEQDAVRRTDLFTFQAEEIESARLKPGEEEEIRLERDRLANAENLADLSRQCLSLLEEGGPESPSVSDLLGQVAQLLSSISRIDTSQAKLAEQADSLLEALSDVTRDLQNYQEQIEFNPRRLEQIEERLDLIHRLKRKYGGDVVAVLAYGREVREKLETIAHAGERILELEAQEQKLLEQLAQQAQILSRQRQKAAVALSVGIERQLIDLSMAGARFQVDFKLEPHPQGIPLKDERVSFDETGVDHVEFMIAPNPGEGFKPLVKIASGGETSRLMLALKNVLAQADNVPTLIFDEIDQGIGGRIGGIIGEKLWQLGRQHQVLCVTHLPQLAAFGDQHYRVQKEVKSSRTITSVQELDRTQRVDELAQMLGELNQSNRIAAENTLEQARRRTKELARAVQPQTGVL